MEQKRRNLEGRMGARLWTTARSEEGRGKKLGYGIHYKESGYAFCLT